MTAPIEHSLRPRCTSCGLRTCAGDCGTAAEREPPDALALPGYRVLRRLGSGAFATVYEAEREDGAVVALKVGHPGDADAAHSLRREAQVLAALVDDAVPRLMAEEATPQGAPIVVMAKVDGPTLAQRLARMQPGQSLGEHVVEMLAVFDAVAAIHDRGWIHGDLKPENIMLGGPRGATLVDFGLARPLGGIARTEARFAAGTVEYMSPEQCTTDAIVDQRSDVYALAVVVYELAFGHPPFSGRAEAVREAHRSQRVPLADRSRPLARFLHACLAKDPAKRPASVKEAREALRIALRDESGVLASESRGSVALSSAKEPGGKQFESVATLYFLSLRSVDGLLNVLRPEGGHLVDVGQERRVVAFRATDRENPALAALRTAESLIRKGLTKTVVIDVVGASVRRRSGMPPRISSPAFTDRHRFPARELGSGVYVREVARATFSECRCEPIPHTDLSLVASDEAPHAEDASITTMAGRDRLLEEVVTTASAAAGGSPVLCTVTGAPGIGKSLLAQAVEASLGAKGQWVTVRVTASEPLESSPRPVAPLLLGSLCGLGRALTSDHVGVLTGYLGESYMQQHGLGLAFALGWIGPSDARLAKLKAAPGALQSLATLALGECLRVMSQRHPTAIILDGAQYVEHPLLGALEYALRSENQGVLWVCVVTRPAFLETLERRAWAAAAANRHAFVIGALPSEAAQALVRRMLAPMTHPPMWALEQICTRADGNPMLLRELVSGLLRSGLIRQGERGNGAMLDVDVLSGIPELPLVDWLVARELEQLPADLRTFAGLAACMGAELVARDMEGVMEAFEARGEALPFVLEPNTGLQRLLEASVLRKRDFGYSFRHDTLRERLRREVDGDLRHLWHRAAYAYFQAQSERREGEELLRQLAHHAAAAGLRSRALDHQLALADGAEARHMYHEAEAHYGRALEFCPPQSSLLRVAWHRRGVLRYRLGLYEPASEALETALEAAQREGDKAAEGAILLDAATVWDWREDHARSAALVERAGECLQGHPSDLLEARLTQARGRCAFRRADAEEASELVLAAATMAESLGEEGYETRVIGLLLAAPLLAFRGETKRAELKFEQLIRLCEEHNDAMHLATAYNNRAALWDVMQDGVRMLQDLERVVDRARTYGFIVLECFALRNAGETHYVTSNYDVALKFAEEAIALGKKLYDAGQRVLVPLLTKMRIHAIVGDLERAAATVAQLRGYQEDGRQQGRSDLELSPSEELLCRMVELFVSGAGEPEWDRILRDTRGETMQGELVELLEFSALSALGRNDPDRARRDLVEALAVLQDTPMLIGERIRSRLRALDAHSDAWPERTAA